MMWQKRQKTKECKPNESKTVEEFVDLVVATRQRTSLVARRREVARASCQASHIVTSRRNPMSRSMCHARCALHTNSACHIPHTSSLA